MLTLEKLADEMRPFHNDVVIVHDHQIGRLIGVADDQFDYYYMVAIIGKGVIFCSAVGSCVSLRGHYPEEAYARIDSMLSHNNAAPTPSFDVRILPQTNAVV